MKINNKGFTLIELLASIVLLSILIAIMVPSVNYLIEKNKYDNYDNLKKSIINAAKVYISDNRYNITLNYADYDGLCNSAEDITEDIASINGVNLKDSKLPIQWLVESKTLSTNSGGKIINPKDKNKILKLGTEGTEYSYVLLKYQCSIKDYTYTLENDSLKWQQ